MLVAIHKNHEIIKSGLYRYIRHPAYLGLLISMYGGAIFLGNIFSFLIVAAPITLALLARIKVEEKLLLKHFGDAYKDYIKNSYSLIPWIY